MNVAQLLFNHPASVRFQPSPSLPLPVPFYTKHFDVGVPLSHPLTGWDEPNHPVDSVDDGSVAGLSLK